MMKFNRFFTAVVALLMLFGITIPAAFAQTIGPARVLIRNAVLFDPAGNTKDKVVNIMIRDNKLDIITEDKISRDEADMVVDANRGVVLGKLNLGSPPNFMIFDEDPRENFEVLMDTFSYTVFVVHEGIVVKNRLHGTVAEEEVDEPSKAGWLAYTPPPLAVPMDYQDSTKWNHFRTKWVNGVFVSALYMDRMNWTGQDATSQQQWGDLDTYDGGEIRGLRFGLLGTLNFEKPWVYTFFAASNAFDKGFEVKGKDNFTLYDYRIDIPFFNNSVMSIGKQKEPISMDRLTGGMFLPNQERSAASDAFMPSRNVGIVWNGSSPRKYAKWALGVFDDFVEDDEDYGDGTQQIVSRVTWAPLKTTDESNLLHLGIGYRHSDVKEGFQYRTEPEFNKAPDFIDTGLHPAENSQTYNYEIAWRRGPALLTSEYTKVDVANADLDNPSFDGYYVTASWILTGEMRPYLKKGGSFGGVPVARTVYQNGKGAWEVYARYSDIDAHDGLIDGGDMQIKTLGVNWWLTPYFGINLGYKFIDFEQYGLSGKSEGMMARVVLVLE
jgi:phosphate-selective porin OprO/OprP